MSEEMNNQYSFENPEYRKTYWHTCSHILAQAMKRLHPEVKLAIGPAIENGFYYDFDTPAPFTEDQLSELEAEMRKICKEKLKLERFELPREEALKFMEERAEPYKVELINDLPADAHISFYKQGEFTDLCAGPHLDSTGRIKGNGIKLTACNAAYWRGDSSRQTLQRIYGVAFPKKEELDAYLKEREEALKRDHNKLGRELEYFTTVDCIGQGLPILLPKGARVIQQLQRWVEDTEEKAGYLLTKTPLMAKRDLYKISGHWDHYLDGMFVLGDPYDETKECFALRPMTCPFQYQVYLNRQRSYRDLPMRLGETSTLFRNEDSGEMHGLFRVRCFTQDDAHIFMTPDQMKDEIKNVVKLFDEIYSTFGLTYQIELSTMPEDHMGDEKDWKFAEDTLQAAITEMGKDFVINAGDGAFYGPKLDFHLADSLGRTWQCGTIQLDFQMPERFDLEYVGEDGEKHRPVMIHRALLGSIERFIGVITEHFAGAFPAWLSPVQVKLLPVTDRAMDYAKNVAAQLDSQGFRVEVDGRNEKIGKKIREATLEKIPFMLVVGDRDMEAGTVSVRTRTGEDLGAMSLADFAAKLHEIVDSKARQ